MYIVCRMIVLHVSMNITIMWFLGWTEKWPGEEIHKDSSELQAANRGHYQAPGEGQEIKERGGSPEEAGEGHREDGANSGETAQRQEQEVHRSVLFPIQRLGLRTQFTTNQRSQYRPRISFPTFGGPCRHWHILHIIKLYCLILPTCISHTIYCQNLFQIVNFKFYFVFVEKKICHWLKWKITAGPWIQILSHSSMLTTKILWYSSSHSPLQH